MRWLIPSGFESSGLDVEKNIDHIGQLMTPRTWGMNRLDKYPTLIWAGDNDCYTNNFKPDVFLAWLEKTMPYRDRCLFITMPDVVGDWKQTLENFWEWEHKVRYHPLAFVIQDGQPIDKIPFYEIDAVFIGGSTEWKMSQDVIRILERADKEDLHRHIGRVNSIKRLRHFQHYADSFDGTDYIYRPRLAIQDYLPEIKHKKLQGKLGL